jgi:hypothetical protein
MYVKTSHNTYGVKRVLRTTFGSERERAVAGWRRLCSDVYFSPFIVTKIHEGKCGGGDTLQGKGEKTRNTKETDRFDDLS